jgi:hypothetical protein
VPIQGILRAIGGIPQHRLRIVNGLERRRYLPKRSSKA